MFYATEVLLYIQHPIRLHLFLYTIYIVSKFSQHRLGIFRKDIISHLMGKFDQQEKLR
jgi:hypothetical protein